MCCTFVFEAGEVNPAVPSPRTINYGISAHGSNQSGNEAKHLLHEAR